MRDSLKSNIAVIGMACKFPGSDNLDEYWNNLILGKDTIRHFTIEEILKSGFESENIENNPYYVGAKGILNEIDKFDAGFFGMTPREAALTDPQHRIWLQTAWKALEHAGYDPITYKGAIGVYAGGNLSSYIGNVMNRSEDQQPLGSAESTQVWLGNDTSFIPTKTAYNFNLRGQAVNVQTACSTSLVAIAQACQSLYSLELDLCIAGGITISIPQEKGYFYQDGGIPSPDGVCRPFDEQARGTVFSNGVGIVVLKRVEDAIKDKDTIYAVVSGWALNNDGNNKMSFTSPSIDGQAEVIMMAQSFAEVSSEDIGYVEAHGTATQIGDPIEIAALTKAFRTNTSKNKYCGIGSVKSNIGHTDSAAGVAAFIKACLSAYYGKIPASLHFTRPNPHIDFENTPFYVLTELKEWTEEKPLIIGVSSFGIGGTNAHVIVEQPPAPTISEVSQGEWPELIVLSAKSEESLRRRKLDLAEFIKNRTFLNIRDVAGTLALGRNHMPYRSFLVATTLEEIISGDIHYSDGKKSGQISKVAFMFPGQGAQYVKMGYDLYRKNSTFRDTLDRCFKIYSDEVGEDLKAVLFDEIGTGDSELRLASTRLTQPALFIVEYALAKVLEQLGVRPDYMVGHSIGEYTAACLSGVFDLPTALKIVIKRGRLMQNMQSGNMMAVRASIDKLKAISASCFEIAADNASESCTISYKTEDKDKVVALLEENGISYLILNTSHAFHSAAFDPILNEFRDYVNKFKLQKPELPFISCLSGTFVTDAQATSGVYWSQQLRNTVRFREGLCSIASKEDSFFIEVGPNTHLSSIAKQSEKISDKRLIISVLGKQDDADEQYKVLAVLGKMFIAGADSGPGNLWCKKEFVKVGLPTYPFEMHRHWIDPVRNNKSKAEDFSEKRVDEWSQGTRKNDSGQNARNYETEEKCISDKITGIWKLLLGINDIGPNDDFFEIGGNSLLALQTLNRIKVELGYVIKLEDFVNNSTINKLELLLSNEYYQEQIKSKKLKERGASDTQSLSGNERESDNKGVFRRLFGGVWRTREKQN
jgi:phthiocerol/phenolphthiocerol synthesis type-I polyketide synthase E